MLIFGRDQEHKYEEGVVCMAMNGKHNTHDRIQLSTCYNNLSFNIDHLRHRRGDGFIGWCGGCGRSLRCGEACGEGRGHGCCGHVKCANM